MRTPLLILALLPLPTFAQDLPDGANLPYLTEADVLGGKLTTIKGPAGFDQLAFNGIAIEVVGGDMNMARIRAVIPADGEDWVLVALVQPETKCAALWTIVATSEAGVRSTERFGTCSDQLLNLRRDGNGIAFEMPGVYDEGGGSGESYRYDGTLTIQ